MKVKQTASPLWIWSVTQSWWNRLSNLATAWD
jgi:hypothetical protein